MMTEYIIEIIKESISIFAIFNIFKYIFLKTKLNDISLNQITYGLIILILFVIGGFMVYLFEFELLFATNPEIPKAYIQPIRITIVALSGILIYVNNKFIRKYYRNQMKRDLGKDFFNSHELKYFKKDTDKFLLKSGNNLIKNYLTEEIKSRNINSFEEMYIVFSEYDTFHTYDNLYSKELNVLKNKTNFIFFKFYDNEIISFNNHEIESIIKRFNN